MPIFSNDLLSFLPEQSRAKIAALDADRDAAIAAVHKASDDMQFARLQHAEAEIKLRTSNNAPRDSDRAKLARLKAEVERAQMSYDRCGERLHSFAVLDDVQQWLVRYRTHGGRLIHAPLPPVQSTVKAGLLQEVQRIRKELAALDDHWRAAEAAPSDKADFKQRAVAEIEALAQLGAIVPDLRNRGPAPLGLASLLPVRLERHSFPFDGKVEHVYAITREPSATFVWLHQEQLVAKISAAIDAAPAEGAMTYAAREKEFARINRERLTLEFREESCIVAAERDGQSIPRRRDADPRCVLEVAEA